jgi:predicted O-linked N-acetylglucosamine transferase (SPINDLY family)
VAAETIAKDGTDILVDLTGHTSSARTGVIARRPAPIQVSYLGYIGSMGAPFIDYVLADSVALPMEQQQYYDEKIVHLPVSYQPNSSTREMPGRSYDRNDCGLPQHGFVFCCFNTSYKISPDVFGLWMRLLASVQGSVLWLVGTNPLAEANLRREATGHGIDPARLLFAPKASYSDYLARCSVADLFLDTWPYSAGATASDALWAGLPLVTRVGRDFAGRMAASVLTAVGLSELIAETDAEYERLALRLATEPAEMRRIRTALREGKRTSGLFDAVSVTRHLEAAYEEMWRRHCTGEAPDNFVVREGEPAVIFTT